MIYVSGSVWLAEGKVMPTAHKHTQVKARADVCMIEAENTEEGFR